MKRLMTLALCAALAACGAQTGGASPEPLPPEVTAAMQQHEADCKAMDGTLTVSDGYVRRAEFNADGKTDYLLDTNKISCSTSASYFCGQLGCSVVAYVSQADGSYKEGLNLSVFEIETAHEGDRDVVSVSGQTLGENMLEGASSRWAYEGDDWKMLERAK